ncbi:Crp/Fnr family transcriptional regulator [Thalassotalea atypica]|uniref:Crp/Fnr family transcriptional regulator n=1 Tax=Thalassotalea atypica TaxID=2054316 RepID=UPI0025724951|nr:helix-turn-helix domain-containing protein [Thalassotalea atypica]
MMSSSFDLRNIPESIYKYFEDSSFKTCSLKSSGLESGFFTFSGLVYIKSGRFSMSMPQNNMETIYSFVIEPQRWLGSVSLLGLPSPVVLINEIEKTELLYIPTKELIQIADNNPMVYKWLLNIATDNFPKWFQAHLIAFSTRETRVLYCLTTLLPLEVSNNNQTEINISQQKISDICGLSRPRVNEVLKLLEQQEVLLLSHKKIQITNINKFFKKLDDANLSIYDPRTQRI